jgi:hypothetical protein
LPTSRLLAAGAGLVVGCAAGVGATAWAMSEFVVDPVVHTHAAVIVSVDTQVLDTLRRGDVPGAAEILEYYLDENVMTLRNFGAHSMDDTDRTILAHTASYRRQFPRASNRPDTDQVVDDFLQRY